MKRFKKIYFLIVIATFFSGLVSPLFVSAADPVKFCSQVTIPIPGFDLFTKDKCTDVSSNTIADAVGGIYKFVVGLAAIAAVIVMMAGGYTWLFAGGNASKVGEAKSLIGSAVLGLFLALGSYMILYLINPELIELSNLKIKTVTPISVSSSGSTANDVNSASYLCSPVEEEKAREKTQIYDGCGKLVSYKDTGSKDCIRTSCFAGQVCVIDNNSGDGGDFFTYGEGCVSKVTAVDGSEEQKDFVTKEGGASAECGRISTDGKDVFSNNCNGDLKYTSCTLIRINGNNRGVKKSGAHWYDIFFADQNNILNMECKGDI